MAGGSRTAGEGRVPVSPVWLGLAAAVALMTVAWVVSLLRRDAGLIDICWGPGFVLVSWVYLLSGDTSSLRGALVLGLVTLWGLRLGLHIAWRSRGKDEDYRYAEMRRKWGRRFPLVSLFTVFLFQASLLWLLSIPLDRAIASTTPVRWIDGIGMLLCLAGLVIETTADLQLTRFRADPANRGRVLNHGLWRYSRHPNYFGDAVVWWGFGVFAVAAGAWWTLYAPAAMTWLLVRVSGVPLLEERLKKTRPAYRDYVERTSAFVPWPPRRHS